MELQKVAWQRGTLHDLRRTYGTRMARVIPMHVLKEYMGHAKITTTQEHYLAAQTEDADRARAAMNAMGGSDASDAESRQGRMLDACDEKPACRCGGCGFESRPPRLRKPR